MSHRRRFSHLLIGCFLLVAWAGAASGQNYWSAPRQYGDERARASELYGDPDPADDFDRPMRARSHRAPAAADDPGDDEDREAPASRGSRRRARVASLPTDADPAYSTPLDLDGDVDMTVSARDEVDDPTGQPAGTITIDTRARKLYLSRGDGLAYAYGVGVGREGFAWKGAAQIGRKAYWPGWTPPREMLLRRPDLPGHMEGGIDNPLGARALYLFKGPRDTLFRIHGTNEPDTIGQAVSSGCIRMLNADVIDLYRRVGKGTRVVVR